LYTLLGETRVGPARRQRRLDLIAQFRSASTAPPEHQTARESLNPTYNAMVRQAEKISGLPVLGHNAADFLTDITTMTDRLIADTDAARSTVHILYFIFPDDEIGTRVAGALTRAAARGIKCRVLADAVASRFLFRAGGLAHRMSAANVQFLPALPVHFIKR